MSVSLEYLQRCSAETGYSVSPLEKVVRLGQMAGDVTRHPFLGSVLALKGGTALNLCFGPPKRLSVDLDYNYIGHAEREKMLEDRPRVEEAVAELSRRREYRLQQSADAFAGRKLHLVYRSVMGQDERIEVDLNFLFRVPLAGTGQRELWQPGELDRPRVHTVSLQEILVGKLLAMLNRGAVRDVWDVANLPAAATDELQSRSFRALFLAFSVILDHLLPTYTRDRLDTLVTERDLRAQLAPMLATNAQARVAGPLVERAWAAVAPLLVLSSEEEAYLAGVKSGQLCPELLFDDDPEAAQRVSRHPAILWKMANVRAYLTRHERKTRR